MRLAFVYDLDACRGPTGVTRHALAQLERLARRPEVEFQVVSGRIITTEGHDSWRSLGDLPRHQLPIRTRDALRWWRVMRWPPLEHWTGPLDWVYCPAEYLVPTKRARRAVTSHDVLQDLRYGSPRRRRLLWHVFASADLIFSVSRFNTERLIEAFPACRDRVRIVSNGADDLFFEPASPNERAAVRHDLGLPEGLPFLLSVANFQARKNLNRLVRATARLPAVSRGELALVLLGTGSTTEIRSLRQAIEAVGGQCVITTPGYRQGKALRAAYAEAAALVFPSLCESFGIPAVEAMAQGCPVALANSTALPEIAGAAGWYFDPNNDEELTATIRAVLDHDAERQRLVELGRAIAETYRWDRAHDQLVVSLINQG